MLQAAFMAVGLTCVLGVVAASMTMNFLFGFGFGTTPVTSALWGGLSVAVDGLKAVLPVMIAAQIAQRRWARAAVGGALFAVVFGYGYLSAVGFAGESRGAFTAARDDAAAAFDAASEDLKALRDRRGQLGKLRLAEQVRADIRSLRRDRLWDLSKECAQVAGDAQRRLCRQFDALGAELAVVISAGALEAKIEKVRDRVEAARAAGGGRVKDYQVTVLAWLFRIDENGARLGLAWYAATLVELVSAFGLLAVHLSRVVPDSEGDDDGRDPEPPWRLEEAGGAIRG